MKPKKQHIIAPKKSDAKKKDPSTNAKSETATSRKNLNEFGDQDAI